MGTNTALIPLPASGLLLSVYPSASPLTTHSWKVVDGDDKVIYEGYTLDAQDMNQAICLAAMAYVTERVCDALDQQ